MLRRVAQAVEHNARLHRRRASSPGSIEVEPVHVPRKIEDDRDVGALAGKAGARAARQHRGAGGAAGGQRGFHVGRVARQRSRRWEAGDSSRRRPHRARANPRSKQHVAAQSRLELRFEFAMGGKALVIEGREVVEDRQRGMAHSGMLARRRRKWLIRKSQGRKVGPVAPRWNLRGQLKDFDRFLRLYTNALQFRPIHAGG